MSREEYFYKILYEYFNKYNTIIKTTNLIVKENFSRLGKKTIQKVLREQNVVWKDLENKKIKDNKSYQKIIFNTIKALNFKS